MVHHEPVALTKVPLNSAIAGSLKYYFSYARMGKCLVADHSVADLSQNVRNQCFAFQIPVQSENPMYTPIILTATALLLDKNN